MNKIILNNPIVDYLIVAGILMLIFLFKKRASKNITRLVFFIFRKLGRNINEKEFFVDCFLFEPAIGNGAVGIYVI